MAQEDRGEKLDRELIELMNGLRVILPGVQVLFAFLLTVPFTSRFGDLVSDQRAAYFTAFICTAASSICLIAPSSYHRLRWRQRDKEQLLRTSNVLAIVGIALLGVAVVATNFLVTDLMFGLGVTALVTTAVAGAVTVLWFGLPLSRRLVDDESSDREPPSSKSGRVTA